MPSRRSALMSSTYYYAPDPAPVFTVNKGAACGTSVSATVTYQLNVLIYQTSIPLSSLLPASMLIPPRDRDRGRF